MATRPACKPYVVQRTTPLAHRTTSAARVLTTARTTSTAHSRAAARSPLPGRALAAARTLLAACALLAACGTAAAADWNVAAGGTPQRSGFVATVGPEQPQRLWDGGRFTRFVRPIAVADGTVFASWNQSGSAFNEVVAFDLAGGTELWSVELPTAGADPAPERCRVSGARDGHLYATRAASRTNPLPMHALDVTGGTLVWTSAALITEASSQSLTFAPGGGLRVSAFDLASGALLYSSDPLPEFGPLTQQGLFAGLDGTIYAPRSGSPSVQNGLFALEDTGSALVTRWTFPLGFGVFSTHGVGADGSIYTHDRTGRLVRLDPAGGSVIDASADPLPGAAASDFNPRLAVDAAGNVFAGNGSFASGAIAAYDANLDLLWSESLGTQSITGPALAGGGELVVQTRFQGMIVYSTQSSGVSDGALAAARGGRQPRLRLGRSYPNPFRARTTLAYVLPAAARARKLWLVR